VSDSVTHVARLMVGTVRPTTAAERAANEVSKLVRDGEIALEDASEVVRQAVPAAAGIQASIAANVGRSYGLVGWRSWLLGLPFVRGLLEQWWAPSRWSRRVLEGAETDFTVSRSILYTAGGVVAALALGMVGIGAAAYWTSGMMLFFSKTRATRLPVLSCCARTPTEVEGPGGAYYSVRPGVALECDKRGHHGLSPNGLGLPVGVVAIHNCPVTQAAAIVGRIFRCYVGMQESGRSAWMETTLCHPLAEKLEAQDDHEWLVAYTGSKLKRKQDGLQEHRFKTTRDINVKFEVTGKGCDDEPVVGGDSHAAVQDPRPIVSCDATVSRVYHVVSSWSKYCRQMFDGSHPIGAGAGFLPVYAIGYNADQLGALMQRCLDFVHRVMRDTASSVRNRTPAVQGDGGQIRFGDVVDVAHAADLKLLEADLAAGVGKINTDMRRYDSTISSEMDQHELREMSGVIQIDPQDFAKMSKDLSKTKATTKYLNVFYLGRRRSGDDVTSAFNSKHMIRKWSIVQKRVNRGWLLHRQVLVMKALHDAGLAEFGPDMQALLEEGIANGYHHVIPPVIGMLAGGDDMSAVVPGCWRDVFIREARKLCAEIGWDMEDNDEDGFYSGLWVHCDTAFEVEMPGAEWPRARDGYTLSTNVYLAPKPGRAWAKFSNCLHAYEGERLRKWALAYIAGVRAMWSRVPVLRALVDAYAPLLDGVDGSAHHKHSPYTVKSERPVEWAFWEQHWAVSRQQIEELENVVRRDAFLQQTMSPDEHVLIRALIAESGYPIDEINSLWHRPAGCPVYATPTLKKVTLVANTIGAIVGSCILGPLAEEAVLRTALFGGLWAQRATCVGHALVEAPALAGALGWSRLGASVFKLATHAGLQTVREQYGFRAAVCAHVGWNASVLLAGALWNWWTASSTNLRRFTCMLTMSEEQKKVEKKVRKADARAAAATAALASERNRGRVGVVSGYSSSGEVLKGLIADRSAMDLAFLQNLIHPGTHESAGRLPDGYTVGPTAVATLKTTGTINADATGNICFRIFPSLKQGLGIVTSGGTVTWGAADAGGFNSWQQYASLVGTIKQYRFTGIGLEIRFLGNMTNCQGTMAEGAQAPGTTQPSTVAAIAALPDSRIGTITEMFAQGGNYYTYWCPIAGDNMTTIAAGDQDWTMMEFSQPARDAAPLIMPAIVVAFEGMPAATQLIQITTIATIEFTANTTIFSTSSNRPDVDAMDGAAGVYTPSARALFAGPGLSHARSRTNHALDEGAHPAASVRSMVNSFLGNTDTLSGLGKGALKALETVTPYAKKLWGAGKYAAPLAAMLL